MNARVNLENQAVGVALLCDAHGTVRQVIRGDLLLADGIVPGQRLTQWVDPGSVAKADRFLAEVRAQGAVFDWQLNVPFKDRVVTLHFAGSMSADDMLVVGARTRNGVDQLFEDLMRINNAQANALRAAIKEQTELAHTQVERDSVLYDDLSRLNNELATLQRELAKKNAELEKLNALKDQFLGMAAHDLRSPLSFVISYSDFLLDEAADVLCQEHLEFLSIIRSTGDFMLRLVDDLLDVSIIESGSLRLERGPTDLIALLERNVALNSVLAGKKQIRLSLHHTEPLPVMLLDAAKIEQVLNNLISNAVKFSPPGRPVQVRVGRRGDEVVISVVDQGPGIPVDERDKLFRWLSRTTVRSTAGEKSTGLGLAISQKIVQGHGGKIWVESQVGQGSTFYVALPIDVE